MNGKNINEWMTNRPRNKMTNIQYENKVVFLTWVAALFEL